MRMLFWLLVFLLLVGPLLLLEGCLSVSDMTAAQLRATNGMALCSQVSTLYGRASSVTVNADDIRKGATGKGKTSIQCGDTTMVIDSEVGK